MATIRKNQDNMSDPEIAVFKDCIKKLIEDETYSKLVRHHSNMNHRMHGTGSGDYIRYHRFLPWHRVFLIELEKEMQNKDANAFIPYWKWTEYRTIPEWIEDFKPDGVTAANGRDLPITRNPGRPDTALPSPDLIDRIKKEKTYNVFVQRLEHSHNWVHDWVDGRMNDILYSPTDPLFWLHHAEIDRLWSEWQDKNPNENPYLFEQDAKMDPWETTAPQVKSIKSLDYRYE